MKKTFLSVALFYMTLLPLQLFSQSDNISTQPKEDSLGKTSYNECYISFTKSNNGRISYDFISLGIANVDLNNRFISLFDHLELLIGINKANHFIIESNLIGLRNNTGKIFGLSTYNDILCGLLFLYQTDAKRLDFGIKAEGKLAIGYANFYFVLGVGYIQSEIGLFRPISYGLSYRIQ